jgi:hypothetical protein
MESRRFLAEGFPKNTSFWQDSAQFWAAESQTFAKGECIGFWAAKGFWAKSGV